MNHCLLTASTALCLLALVGCSPANDAPSPSPTQATTSGASSVSAAPATPTSASASASASAKGTFVFEGKTVPMATTVCNKSQHLLSASDAADGNVKDYSAVGTIDGDKVTLLIMAPSGMFSDLSAATVKVTPTTVNVTGPVATSSKSSSINVDLAWEGCS